jgi:hypothetical protein
MSAFATFLRRRIVLVKTRVLFVVLGSLAFAACSAANSAVTPSSTAFDQPNAAASNPLKASVSSLSLTSKTSAVKFVVSEKAYKGAFSATGCAANITLSPKQGKGPSQQFAASIVKAGKCTLRIADTKKHSVAIAVTVTTTSGVIQ